MTTKETRQKVRLEMEARKKRRWELMQKRIKRQAEDLAARVASTRGRFLPVFSKKQHAVVVYIPRELAITRSRTVKVDPKIWGKRISATGLQQCEFSVRGLDVFVMRVRRDYTHYYVWAISKSGSPPMSGAYKCECDVHEAKALNAMIGDVVDVLFRAG